ncbi:hypothetical protein [Roseomonas sp. BN140053]|uniref:hypothetical protein n=1 Tax=Roseomonas sp. BN140053 TaxID=3391898 RepID=UPI0039ECD4A8
MRKIILLGAGLAALASFGSAMAQTPPAPVAPPGGEAAPRVEPPPPPPGGPGLRGPGPMGQGMGPGMGHGWGRGPRGFGPPPPRRAASFHVERGDMEIHIRCAETEPTRACVDAAGSLLDKIASMPATR